MVAGAVFARVVINLLWRLRCKEHLPSKSRLSVDIPFGLIQIE